MSHTLLAPPVAVSPVRIEDRGHVLCAYVTYHPSLRPALAYYAVATQWGWAICTKRDRRVIQVDHVDDHAATGRIRAAHRLRLLGMRWSAMSGKDSTRTDGNPSKPRRTDLDQPDPGGKRDSATDR